MAELDGVPVSAADLQALGLVNYGHFTSMRVDDQRVRGLALHLDRLTRDCRTLFDVELDRDRIRELIRRGVGNRSGSFVTRVTVFDPALDMSRPGAATAPKILVTTRPAPAFPAAPMRLGSVRFSRDLPAVKHVGLCGSFLRRRWAQLGGFDDALFVDADARVGEGPTWNIGFFDGERIIWPDAEVLPGVTMRLLQQAHERTAIEPVTLDDLPRLRAAFATNTSTGVRPVGSIDGHALPGDPRFLEALRDEYEKVPADPL